jgi:hypothetical protein
LVGKKESQPLARLRGRPEPHGIPDGWLINIVGTHFKLAKFANLTGHKKIRLCDGADTALSVLIILSTKKRRTVKRFFMYRQKVKTLKTALVTAPERLAVCFYVFINKTLPRGNRPFKKRLNFFAEL